MVDGDPIGKGGLRAGVQRDAETAGGGEEGYCVTCCWVVSV